MVALEMLYLLVIILGLVLSLSSTIWWGVWGGMEISMLGFMFYSFTKRGGKNSEGLTLYFLLQGWASMLLLFLGLYVYEGGFFPDWGVPLFLIILLVKLGSFPFHFWVMPVIKELSVWGMFILLGPLKIIPLFILYDLSGSESMSFSGVCFAGILSMVVGSFLGLNCNTFSTVLGASSIAHTGWLILSVLWGGFPFYLGAYLISSLLVFGALKSGNKVLSALGIFSMSGLPPFILFFSKINVMMYVFEEASPAIMMLLLATMVFSVVLSLVFYLKFTSSFLFKFLDLGFVPLTLLICVNVVLGVLFLSMFNISWMALDFWSIYVIFFI
uniref:NADH dehydrogenase subunit 2 n=1 Tax=Discus perspectivus TaxID=697275 RepID=UPI002176B2EF|nr:NADH dehydrogenase subunit 2 [Discus perspectivus]UUB71747.1 NADH dehydrogenase subunit 2 [Discus perspectivus]